MDTSKIQVKISMTKGADVDYQTWHRVFNQWIPEPGDDILIDVADYSHVPNGPVALLVGHHANYAVDTAGGELGFACKRKQPLSGTFADRLEAVMRSALAACARLEADPLIADQIAFDARHIEIAVNDRLAAPNTDDAVDGIRDDLDAVLSRLFAGADYSVERVGDSRRRLTLDVRAQGDAAPAQLLQNLG